MKNPLLLILLFLCAPVLKITAQSATQVTLQGSLTTNTISNNVATAVDPNLVVTANGNLTGFIVSITDSYTSGDVLSYTGGLPSGVSAAAFNTTTRSLVFTGTTSAANWQALLRTVTLQTSSATCFPERRAVSFTVGNKNYNPLTGHFYEYVSTTQNWVNAKTNAESQSYFGRQGYLATITSAAENNFIWKIMPADAWVGGTYDYTQLTAAGITAYANQAAAIGNPYWVTGPERGTAISTGLTSPVAVNGQYMNWTSGEPNNYNNSSEYYIQLYSSTQGLWNDLPLSSTLTSIIEYGGMPNDLTTSAVVFTRNIYVNGAPSGTISGGGASVCSGTNSTTLTLSGYTGTVVRWESSADNFLTAGTTINNTTASYTVSNITQTTYYRAIVNTTSPATCTNLTTSSVPVYVTATIPGNVFSNNVSICPGAAANLTLYGNSGNVVKWQVSTSSTFASGNTDISSTSSNISYTLGSTGTYYFRAQVQNSGCGTPVYTSGCAITVTSGTPPVGGAVTNAEFCSGSNSGTLTLTGITGTVSKWQYSTDNGIIWTDVANTTTSLSYSGISGTTLYRAVVTNGTCGTAYSTGGKITVYGNTQYKWLGGTSTDLQNTTNWLCGNKPVAGADVVVSSTATYDMVLDQSYTLGNIDFTGASVKVLLGAYDLTLNSITGATSNAYLKTNGTGKVKMNISKNAFKFFPLGNSAYNPLQITNNSNSADDFSVQVIDQVYANGTGGTTLNNYRVNRTWDISKATANSGSGIDLAFSWNAGEALNVSTARMYHYDGTTWVKQTGTTSFTTTSLNYSGYTGTFSPFSIGDNFSVLPVTWLSINGYNKGNSNYIEWSTATEQRTRYFVVEYSVNGSSFSEAGQVAAAGNSGTAMHYNFTHQNSGTAALFYRVKLVDVDGNNSYSKVIRIAADNGAGNSITVAPNPTGDVANVHIYMGRASKAAIQVTDISGKKIYSDNKDLQAGNNALTIDLSRQPAGIYLLKIKDDSGSEFVNKIIKN